MSNGKDHLHMHEESLLELCKTTGTKRISEKPLYSKKGSLKDNSCSAV